MNIKTTFLYDDIKKIIYIIQSIDFEVKGKKNKIYKLTKALYGLKQFSRVQYNILIAYLKELGFESIAINLSIFINKTILVTIYVNDILIIKINKANI